MRKRGNALVCKAWTIETKRLHDICTLGPVFLSNFLNEVFTFFVKLLVSKVIPFIASNDVHLYRKIGPTGKNFHDSIWSDLQHNFFIDK
jgi:hypothetical protein